MSGATLVTSFWVFSSSSLFCAGKHQFYKVSWGKVISINNYFVMLINHGIKLKFTMSSACVANLKVREICLHAELHC